MKNIFFFFCILTILNSTYFPQSEKIIPMQESQAEYNLRMQWWRSAKFGLFIHWGLYSILAGEWKGETKYAEWIRNIAQIPIEVYDKLVSKFNPVKFNADDWVRQAKNAGMKYIVITSKHHDGFCLFDSKFTDFDVMSTPFKRDILKELSAAAAKAGIKFGLYYSIMDWRHPDYIPRRGWEKESRPADTAEFENYIVYMKNQLREIIENYDPDILWFDGEWEGSWTHEYGVDLYNYVRNLKPSIIINNRVDVGRSGMAGITKEGFAGDFGTPEQEIPSTGIPGVNWESCMTMNDHWGFNKIDDNWKSAEDLVRKLVDISSKGGNFLLNIGPTAEGLFPAESIKRLKQIGEWMSVNSKSIYGTEASPFKKLSWGRCTQEPIDGGTRLFLHIFDYPEDGKLVVPGIFNDPLKAYQLTDKLKNNLEIVRFEDALILTLPEKTHEKFDAVVILEIKGKPDVSEPPKIEFENKIFLKEKKILISSDRENVEIRYTTDGSIPRNDSFVFEKPLIINKTTTISARCFRNGKPVSDSSRVHFEKVAPLQPLEADNLNHGIVCNFFEGDWDMLPDFERMNPVKTSIVNSFGVQPKLREEYYGLEFYGYIKIPKDDVYTFFTSSDDGSQLFVDDQLVVDNDGLHGMETQSGVIPLAEGFHEIEVKFFEKTGGDDLSVQIKHSGSDKMSIPEDMLFYQK